MKIELPGIILAKARHCDDTDLVTNLVTEARKRRSPLEAGFASA
jgi:hypothetical protein